MAEKINGKYGVREPNQSEDGKMVSNMTGDSIESNYDYGSISDRDKKVVNEIINFLRQRKGIPIEMVVEEIKKRFQLVEIPMKKIEDSVWGQFTKDERLGQSIQGFRTSKDKNGNSIKIPHVGFSADLDYLDEFVNRLVQKAKDIK